MSKIFNLIIYSIQLNKSIQSIDMNAELADVLQQLRLLL